MTKEDYSKKILKTLMSSPKYLKEQGANDLISNIFSNIMKKLNGAKKAEVSGTNSKTSPLNRDPIKTKPVKPATSTRDAVDKAIKDNNNTTASDARNVAGQNRVAVPVRGPVSTKTNSRVTSSGAPATNGKPPFSGMPGKQGPDASNDGLQKTVRAPTAVPPATTPRPGLQSRRMQAPPRGIAGNAPPGDQHPGVDNGTDQKIRDNAARTLSNTEVAKRVAREKASRVANIGRDRTPNRSRSPAPTAAAVPVSNSPTPDNYAAPSTNDVKAATSRASRPTNIMPSRSTSNTTKQVKKVAKKQNSGYKSNYKGAQGQKSVSLAQINKGVRTRKQGSDR